MDGIYKNIKVGMATISQILVSTKFMFLICQLIVSILSILVRVRWLIRLNRERKYSGGDEGELRFRVRGLQDREYLVRGGLMDCLVY